MNILITQDKNIKFLFKIYYFIFLLIVLSVLTSLIYTNTFYQKSYTQKDIPLNHAEKDRQVSYIIDLKTSKSLQQNELIYDTRIDQIRETKLIPNIKVSQLPKDLKSIKSIKNRKELFSNYIADGKKNWEKNKSHFKGSYISDDMAICSKLTEEN